MSNVFKLYGEIGGFNPFTGTSGVTVADVDVFIANAAAYDTLVVEIDSYGGNVDEAFAIYDKLKATGKRIETIGYRVASAATVVFLAGDKRSIARNALFNVHFPFIEYLDGKLTSDELKKIAAEIEQYDRRILKFYKKALNLDSSDVEELIILMKEDKDIGANGALSWGFATHILDKAPVALSNSIINMFKPKTKTMKNKSILSRIQALLTEVKAASAQLNDGTTIYFDSEAIEVGTALFTDEALTTALADGDYTLSYGTVITVENGVVTAIVAPAQVSEDVVEALALIAREVAQLKALFGAKQVNAKANYDKAPIAANSTPLLDLVKRELKK